MEGFRFLTVLPNRNAVCAVLPYRELCGEEYREGLEHDYRRLIQLGVAAVRLDLRAVEFIDGAFVGPLVLFARRLAAGGGRLTVEASPNLAELFRILKLDLLFEVLSAGMFMGENGGEVFLGASSVDLCRIGATIRDLLASKAEQALIRGFVPAPNWAGDKSLSGLVVRRGDGRLRASLDEGELLVIQGTDVHLSSLAIAFDFSDTSPPGTHSALFDGLHGEWEDDTPIMVVIGIA